MIYTVTLNPSIDYVISMSELRLGEVNRTESEQVYPGGKGLNVSMVLKALGRESVALGFVAGFTGMRIAACMDELGIPTDFIQLEQGFSRINVKIKTKQAQQAKESEFKYDTIKLEDTNTESRLESEINGRGPVIEEKHIQLLFSKLEKLQPEDVVVLAGSLPKGVPVDLYGQVCSFVNAKGAKVFADASGEVLKQALKGKPFLVKPNLKELEQLMGDSVKTQKELLAAGKKLLSMGAEHAIISCGKDGAVLFHKEQVIWQKTVAGTIVNTVGSGDSLVAGCLDGWLRNREWKAALKEGVAAGTASAFCQGLADGKQISNVLATMEELGL